jgi:hypothetical protein
MNTTNYKLLLALLFTVYIGAVKAQVNLQTGAATFSLPLFNWQDHKGRLNSVVALNYNSGNGLKVSEVASNVGQGWSLVAGGVITRMQVGEPDDQIDYQRNTSEHNTRKFPPGYLYATIKPEEGCPTALTKYPLYKAKNQVYAQHNAVGEDKQLDYFSFQFNGKSGLFILDKANGDKGVMLGDSKIKITFQRDPALVNNAIRTTIKSFTIQDVDGLIYTFSQHGLTKVLENGYCDGSLKYEEKQPKLKDGNVYNQTGFDKGGFDLPYVIGSWYLTRVVDPLTNRAIQLSYATQNINQVAGQDLSYNHTTNYSTISHKRSITQTPDITAISYPDGHSVTFTYGSARIDMNGQYALAAVKTTYKGRALSEYQLNTTYFILNRYGTPTTDYQKRVARLCLRSVKKIGVDLKEDTPPYVFDYFLGSNAPDDVVPPPFHFAKDIWGFYNGNNSTGYWHTPIDLNKPVTHLSNDEIRGLCFLKHNTSDAIYNAKDGLAKNGLLKQIIYPTGGTLAYEYGQNKGAIGGAFRSVGGVHVVATKSTDGGHSNGCDNPVTTQYNYVLDQAGESSSLWGLEAPLNHMTVTSYYKPESQRYKWGGSNCAIFGCCYYKFMYPGILSQQQAINLTDWQKFMESAAPVLGILSTVSTIMDVANLFLATGPTPAAIIAVVIDVIVGIITIIDTCTRDMSKSSSNTVYYNSDLNSASPLPMQFKRVEIIENPGTIGKTIHEFTSDQDYPIWHLDNPALSAKQRFAPWAYGLPKLTVVKDAAGRKVKETGYQYDDQFWQRLINHYPPKASANKSGLYTDLMSCKCLVTHNGSQKSTEWNDPAQYNPNNPGTYQMASDNKLKVDFNGYFTGRMPLRKQSERVFKIDDPSQYLETTTDYQYNDYGNYEVANIHTIMSSGDRAWKSFKYSDEFSGGVFDVLKQNNIITLPVSTTTAVQKIVTGNPNSAETHEAVTTFTQLPNGDIKPLQVLERRYSRPSIVWDPNSVIPPQIPVQSFQYDNSGNLIGLKDEGGRVVTNLYGYDDKFVVASVINADPATDKSAYTSFETNNMGGWQRTALTPQMPTTSLAVTGSRGGNLFSDNTLVAGQLNTAKPYKLSFWATSTLSVSGNASLITAAPTINGFTYYEYDLPPGTSSVTVSGEAKLDELRLYPKGARMRTVTYDPLIGKTSECDENNRITYYEYDNLGRLQFIKDENRNAVKMYEYNNVSKQSGCPAIYYSKLTKEIIRKNNCGAGYEGGEYTYTVPANKYSSTISQEDADAQVEMEILANGQSQANAAQGVGCKYIHYNEERTFTEISEDCPIGYAAGPVTYVVPAGKYSSTISLQDANDKALRDIEANGWAFVNNPANANCTYSTDPFWSWESGATQCRYVNGQAHRFIQEIDINPNSNTYGHTRWSNIGPTTPTSDCITTPNCTNCTGFGQRCVNGICEMGFRINTQSYWDHSMGQYVCIFHYEWSDGLTSQDYYDYSGGHCPL